MDIRELQEPLGQQKPREELLELLEQLEQLEPVGHQEPIEPIEHGAWSMEVKLQELQLQEVVDPMWPEGAKEPRELLELLEPLGQEETMETMEPDIIEIVL